MYKAHVTPSRNKAHIKEKLNSVKNVHVHNKNAIQYKLCNIYDKVK